MNAADQAPCADCEQPTAPCTGKRGCRHKGKWEFYMVHDHVWQQVGDPTGFLCIGCLERRLRRHLTPDDFTAAPVNEPGHPWNTARLDSRLTGHHHE